MVNHENGQENSATDKRDDKSCFPLGQAVCDIADQ